jgi:2-(1,2-epoxy-1,2-dihydrophenyl)acetyl-CoA isomerase
VTINQSPAAGDSIMWAEVCAGAARRTLTHETADALLEVIAQARTRRPKVLVLTGGEDAWCFGGDVATFASSPDRQGYIDELATRLHAAVSGLQSLDAIVLSVVDGVAAGAGMPLAAAGDILLASSRARFTLGYSKLGLTPDGGTTTLSASVGVHRLLYAALVNPIMDAETALRQGLVAEVVPPESLMARAQQLAGTLAHGSAEALSATKHLIRRQALPTPAEALEREQTALRAAAGSADATEGLFAFVEKRSPSFA